MFKTIEIFATILTIAGFFILSLSPEFRFYGFLLSLASNILWIVWGSDQKAFGIITVNSCLLLSSINGIIGSI